MRAEPGPVEQRFERALENAERFFMKTGMVHQAALAIARRLDAANIPYAIVGAMALGAHGYERMTSDVDVLLTREGLALFKKDHLGRGCVEQFPGSKGVRDTEHGVSIDVLIAGEFPGDGLCRRSWRRAWIPTCGTSTWNSGARRKSRIPSSRRSAS